MVLSGKLYAPLHYHKALRAQLVAAYSGASLELVEYCPGVSSPPAGFENCPAEAAPLFRSSNDVILFDANAIAYFLGNKQLRGGELEYYVTQWVNFTDQILLPSIAAWLYPTIGATSYNKQQVTRGQENVKMALIFLNQFLLTRTYFVGENVTQADLTLFSALRLLFENLLDADGREPYPHLVRWYITIANQPDVKKVVGDMRLCEIPVKFDPKNAQKTKQKVDKNQAKHPQPSPTTKEPKGEEEPCSSPEDDKPASKRPSNPLASLPVGTFEYDTFKRVFSNEDTKTVTIPFFWEKFDPTTDSIWYCEYNYPEELKFTFMSANLLRGMFQRLDKMQKFSFAIMNVYGENNKSTIGGIWVWRGTGLIFDLSPDLQTDFESYTWTKLDPTAPETKAKIADYFALGDECDGKPVAETCVFK